MLKKTFSIFIIITVLAVIVWSSEFKFHFSLSFLKNHYQQSQQQLQAFPLIYPFGFFLLYILLTACSIPGITLLTLMSGALFGFFKGTLIVSFASTIGSTLAFLVSRWILKDFVLRHWQPQFVICEKTFQEKGLYYLLLLRLTPLFPAFLVNLLMGLMPINPLTFFIISQIGMLPLTMLYISAGTHLSQISSASDILSWPIILLLTTIGLIPLGFKILWQQKNLQRHLR